MNKRAGIVGTRAHESRQRGASQAHTHPADPPPPRRPQLRREAGDVSRQSISNDGTPTQKTVPSFAGRKPTRRVTARR